MSTVFITYLWHYLTARVIYDDLLRPLAHGHPGFWILIALLIAGAFVLGRRSGRRNWR